MRAFKALLFLVLMTQPAQHFICQTSASKSNNANNQALAELKVWISDQVKAGRVANLLEYPGGSDKVKDVVLPSDFIVALLKDPEKHFTGTHIANAKIDGLTLRNTEISSDINLSYCTFYNLVDLSQSTFRNVTLEGSKFQQEVKFDFSKFNGNLNVKYAQFLINKPVDFSGMEVRGNFSLSGASFAGTAWFQGSKITQNFDLKGAKFTNKGATAKFQNMTVEGDLIVTGTPESPTIFEAEVTFEDAKIGGAFKSSRETSFTNTENLPRFSNMKVGTAELYAESFVGRPKIDGMTYANWPRDNLQDLLKLLDKAQYNPQAYATAESFLKNNGQAALADDVFIRQKIAERAGLPWYSRPWNRFMEVFVGYGRKPWLAFIWWLVVVGLGTIIFFQKDWMSLSDKRNVDQKALSYYNPFWYSLDLFAPVIDLGVAKAWEPGPEHVRPRFARQYVHIHKILGWILVPIGVAALTGYLK